MYGTSHVVFRAHLPGLQSSPQLGSGCGQTGQRGQAAGDSRLDDPTTVPRPDLGARLHLKRAGMAVDTGNRVEGSRSSARLRHVQPDLGGQDHVRARLRTPILESARAHSSRAVSLRDTVYETLSGSTPKMGAPEATSTIALSLMMILTPHSRPACWLAAWLQWQHHPRWHRWRPSAARGKPPGSGRARAKLKV